MCKSGNVASQSLFTYDRCDVEQAGKAQDFVIGDEIVPANVQDARMIPHMEGVQSSPVGLYECPASRAV